ncbi:MAG TPA: Sir2 family NAD-dependent protein deacetylase [Jatrophihabitans sp.]|nr:Sir2 family NAD-dependent protein deacetylase [Jatrophihabitans sp.]
MPPTDHQLSQLAELVADGDVLVLSGAGLSTESGIPDYRGPTGRARPATPMTFGEFTGHPAGRQRYWARSHRGWQGIVRAAPNDGHRAVAWLQQRGLLSGIITQNVDGLHQAAGAHPVIELHGGLDRVICLECKAISERDELHVRLVEVNPAAVEPIGIAVKPDGDVELDAASVAGFRLVDCLDCGGGPLKPDVVFFGENVPADRVAACYDLLERSRLLLVLGSSLTVASGYRFVRRADRLGIGVAIVNQGGTRGDPHARLKIDAPLGQTLTALRRELAGRPGQPSARTRTGQGSLLTRPA